MKATYVTSKGRVTIPRELRQKLGIRPGSRIAFSLVGDHAVMKVCSASEAGPASGFGTVASRRASVPVDLDPARLVRRSS